MMMPLPPSTPSYLPGLQHDGGVIWPALHRYGLGWENPWVGRLGSLDNAKWKVIFHIVIKNMSWSDDGGGVEDW